MPIPEHWKLVKLGEVCRVRNGYAFKSNDYRNDGILLFRQTNLNGERVNLKNAVYLPKEFLDKFKEFQIKKGDVLIGMSGSVGKLCVYNLDKPALQNQRTGLLLFTESVIRGFVRYYFEVLEKEIIKKSKGVAVLNVSAKDIHDSEIPLPPIAEQAAIVAKLDQYFSDLDAGVAALRTAQAQLKTYQQAVLKYAFEGKLTAEWRQTNSNFPSIQDLLQQIKHEREKHGKKFKEGKQLNETELKELPKLPEEWTWIKLEEIADIQLGRQRSPKNRSNLYPIKYLRAANITENGLDLHDLLDMEFTPEEQKIYRLHYGDLVLSEASGSASQVGKPAIWKAEIENICFQNTVLRVTPFLVSSKYYFYFFYHCYKNGIFSTIAAGVGINHLSAGKLSALPIPLCSLDEQQAIVQEIEDRLSVADKLEETLRVSLQQADALRQSLLHAAFTGRLLSPA